jgi:hypothetical protein
MNTKITRPAVALLTAACVGTAEIQPGHEPRIRTRFMKSAANHGQWGCRRCPLQ